jgi:hypothetical protein
MMTFKTSLLEGTYFTLFSTGRNGTPWVGLEGTHILFNPKLNKALRALISLLAVKGETLDRFTTKDLDCTPGIGQSKLE